MDGAVTLWTIGHSTRSREDFLALLDGHGIQAVADVRRFPGSRRHPWFAGGTLAHALPAAGIDYLWLPQLGGRRRARPGSPNGAWRNAAFQGYADHLDSTEFADGLARLLELAARRRTALMCAEAPWWRCHRRLIADLLSVRGIPVRHILDAGPARAHVLTASARVVDGRLRYPPPQDDLFA
ncbi:MAG: DUF488 domain-containing protein [Stenotrophomonas sp.]|uniref:DUF488 domain-containing protein n=1 Tax=Stenotrophomonas TaxID=40323 RepID=UPI00135342A1|nr:DUF488 domain-containing protein [Stenotrophomonas sp.]MTI73824.1 DUF488 domain-containing protein [Stenotrophomonas sp.]